MSVLAQRPRTEPPKRRHERSEDAPVANRQVSSMELVLDRAQAALRAWATGDIGEIRFELRQLSDEAALLAQMKPLPLPGLLHARQRIAVERDSSRRAGSS